MTIEHEHIWLEPAPGADEDYGRQWCQQNVWGDEATEYVLATMNSVILTDRDKAIVEQALAFYSMGAQGSAEDRFDAAALAEAIFSRSSPENGGFDFPQEARNLSGIIKYMDETSASEFEPQHVVFLISLVRDLMLREVKS